LYPQEKQVQVLTFLLTVDYRENLQQQDVFGFFKEARPSDSEVLTMRLVDRVLRPLFPWITMLKFK
jgi:polyribonucleotide nucleotidyltransferase